MPSRRLEGDSFEIVKNPFIKKATQYNNNLMTRLTDYASNISPDRNSTLPTLKQTIASALAFFTISYGGVESANAKGYEKLDLEGKPLNSIELLYKEGIFTNPKDDSSYGRKQSAVEKVFVKLNNDEPENPFVVAGKIFEASLKDSANAGPEVKFTISSEGVEAGVSGNFNDIKKVPQVVFDEFKRAIKNPVGFISGAIMSGLLGKEIDDSLEYENLFHGNGSEFSR